MRFESKERAKLRRSVALERRMFLAEFPWCWFCGARADCVHEIACGSHRKAALSQRLTWAAACSECNCHRLTDYATWPLAAQLAAKWIHDRKFFRLVDFNRLRGRADGAIVMAEVIPHVCRLLDGGLAL